MVLFNFSSFCFTALTKSDSESSISEACDSLKESKKRFETERDDCSDKEETHSDASTIQQSQQQQSQQPQPISTQLDIPKSAMAKRGSLTSAKSLHELKQDRGSIDDDKNKSKDFDCNSSSTCDDTITQIDSSSSTSSKSIGLRPSKSDTSITDSFVVVDKEYNKKTGQHSLRTG